MDHIVQVSEKNAGSSLKCSAANGAESEEQLDQQRLLSGLTSAARGYNRQSKAIGGQ